MAFTVEKNEVEQIISNTSQYDTKQSFVTVDNNDESLLKKEPIRNQTRYNLRKIMKFVELIEKKYKSPLCCRIRKHISIFFSDF